MASALSSILMTIAGTVGSAAVIALLAYLRSHGRDHEETRERLARIEAEFNPNGGTSARDLQEDLLTAIHHLAREQGIQPPPRRSRPRREE
ncbi:hypothetical protein [Streptomyces mirabilis]|uniref:hypothetical protein n=1 Tax=Streptomyces mirabilis TaxID=68239 RepID=UPI0036C8A036